MVSADLHADALQLVPGLQDEPTTTKAQGLTNRFLDMLQKEADGPLRSLLMSEIVLIMTIAFLCIRHVIAFLDPLVEQRGSWICKKIWTANGCVKSCINKESTRTFCQGLIVLQFYYSEHLEIHFPMIHKNPFMSSCFLLLFDSSFFWIVGDVIIKSYIMQTPPPDPNTDGIKVNNHYMNISKTGLHRTSMYFFVQFLLMLFYVYSLNDKEAFQREDDVSYVKWLGAMFLTVLAGKNEGGTKFEFEFEFWRALEVDELPNWFVGKKTGFVKTDFIGCVPVPLRYQWRLRRFYSHCVNLIFRQVIFSTAPVMLSVAEPLDFIRDALAVFFITNLDDLADPKDFQTVKQELLKDLEDKGLLKRRRPAMFEPTSDLEDPESESECGKSESESE